MVVEVAIPKLGLTMTEALLVRWLVEDGEEVRKGQPICEIETDKVSSETEATADGTLRIAVEAGSVIPVTGVIGHILTPGEEVPGTVTPSSEQPMPLESRAESRPGKGHLLSGQRPADPAALPTPRAHLASPAARRRARELNVDIKQVKGTGENGRITIADVESFAAAVAEPASTPTQEVRASPLAKRIAREAGIDLKAVRGTGAGGRITKEDVEKAILERSLPAPAPTKTPSPEGELIPFSVVRSIIAERMLASSQETASVTISSTVDATELVNMRAQLNERFSDDLGFRISYNDILIKTVAGALKEFPYMNAHQEKGAVRLLPEVHIGLAVDTERGLLVVVVHDADQKSIPEISREARDRAERAIAGKISPDELTGSTFTITNLGMLGVEAFTPIINPPEVAILGIGRIAQEPTAYRGEICLRYRMVLSLTFDHRLVDGAPAARFLGRVKDLIEKPDPMMIDSIP